MQIIYSQKDNAYIGLENGRFGLSLMAIDKDRLQCLMKTVKRIILKKENYTNKK